MSLHEAVALGTVGVALVAMTVASVRRPEAGLFVLLCLLPFQTGIVLVLRNWFGLPDLVVQAVGAWKEAILVGLVIAAIPRARHVRPSPIALVALALLGVIAVRAGLDIVSHAELRELLYGARNLGEFAVLVLVVAVLRPSAERLRTLAWTLVPIGALAAEIAIVILAFGLPLYNILYINTDGTLSGSFLVQFSGEYHPRASGTYISPNEFGLAMSAFLCAVVLPLWGERHSRRLLVVGGSMVVAAILLSYSRSAWLGLAAGLLVAAVPLRHRLLRAASMRDRHLLRDGRVRVALLGGALVLGVLAVVTRAAALVLATFRGLEPSAAGRPDSLMRGIEAFLRAPLGLGLGSAGPKAVGLDPSAILTENWYLVYGIQLGWAGLALLLLLAALTMGTLWRRVAASSCADGPLPYGPRLAAGSLAALAAALVGGLVIPAFLDLPGSLTIWALAVAAAHLPVQPAEPNGRPSPVPATPAPRSSDA